MDDQMAKLVEQRAKLRAALRLVSTAIRKERDRLRHQALKPKPKWLPPDEYASGGYVLEGDGVYYPVDLKDIEYS